MWTYPQCTTLLHMMYKEYIMSYNKLQLKVCVNIFIGSPEYYTQLLCYSYDAGWPSQWCLAIRCWIVGAQNHAGPEVTLLKSHIATSTAYECWPWQRIVLDNDIEQYSMACKLIHILNTVHCHGHHSSRLCESGSTNMKGTNKECDLWIPQYSVVRIWFLAVWVMFPLKSSIVWAITSCLLSTSCRFLACLIIWHWRWRWHVPPKHQLTLNRLHDVTFHKTELFITTAVRTSNLTFFPLVPHQTKSYPLSIKQRNYWPSMTSNKVYLPSMCTQKDVTKCYNDLQSCFWMTISNMLQQVTLQFCSLVAIWALKLWLLATFLSPMTDQRSLPSIYLPTISTWKFIIIRIWAIYYTMAWRDSLKLKIQNSIVLLVVNPQWWVERLTLL
jgi:hypothetical protein